MLTRAPILEAPDEPDRLPALVDRAALVVDESSSEANPLDGLEVEVGVDVRGFLRPGDPEAVGWIERGAELREAPLEIGVARGEEDDHARAWLGAELRRERCRRVVLLADGATVAVADAPCSGTWQGRRQGARRSPSPSGSRGGGAAP